jgi:hypothetical protein
MHYNKKVTGYYYGINPVFPGYTTIFLYGEAGKADLVGRLYFEPDNKTVLTPHRFENGCPVLYFRHNDMSLLIDMLRNESAIWLWAYVSDGINIANAMLSTDYTEPAGKGKNIYHQP